MIVPLLLLGAGRIAHGQAAAERSTTIVPATGLSRDPDLASLGAGANATVTLSGVHDSSIGWYNVVTPELTYSFSPRFSADASLSIFPYRLVQDQTSSAPQLNPTHGQIGDTLLAVHGSFFPRRLENTTTVAFTLPTGNQADGLGMGKATIDLSNHSERFFGRKGLLLDLGLGDSSGLFNRLVESQDSTLAVIAHFQAGTTTPLPFQAYLQTTAYEQLPLGDQKIYSVVRMRNRAPVTYVSGRRASEDNGFTSEFTLPVTNHLIFSTLYTRSLRLRLDTVSVSMTYTWKGLGRRHDSMIDKAIAEAERTPQ